MILHEDSKEGLELRKAQEQRKLNRYQKADRQTVGESDRNNSSHKYAAKILREGGSANILMSDRKR